MANQAKLAQKPKVSRGTQIAAKVRTRANSLTDEQRQAHRAAALSIIYGNPDLQVSQHAHRR